MTPMRAPSLQRFRWMPAAGAAAALAALAALAAAGAGGCARSAPPPPEGVPELRLDHTNRLRVGDPFTARLDLVHPAGAEVWMDDVARDRELVVRAFDRASAPLDPARTLTSFRWELASFEVGEHTLFTGRVTVAHAGATNALALPEARFTVQSVLPAPAAAADTNAPAATLPPDPPMEPLAPPAPWPRWLWVLPLVALLALGAAWLLRRHLLRPGPAAPPPPPVPPHLVALTALEALWARGHHERGEAEPFYVALSAIVRRYLEDRFGLRAPERTTDEFLREMAADLRLAAGHRELTAAFLTQADLVKFARVVPGAEAMRAAYDAAGRLVRETIAAPAAEAAPAAPDAPPSAPAGGAA